MADRSFAVPGNPRYPAAAWHARVAAQRARASQGVARLAEASKQGEHALAAQTDEVARKQVAWREATNAYHAQQASMTPAWQLALAATARASAGEAVARAAAAERQTSAASATRREALREAGQRLARAKSALDVATTHREQWQQARRRDALRKL